MMVIKLISFYKITLFKKSSIKESLGRCGIVIVLSRHVVTVVSLSHKKADSHIHVNIEFGRVMEKFQWTK